MNIIGNVQAIGFGLSTQLSVQGGTAPYTWSMLAAVTGDDTAGGSVNSSGLYTAPRNTGVDTVKVVDSVGTVATFEILVLNTLMIFCDIIKREMQLDQDQVFLWDQTIPTLSKDNRLYIAVGVLTSKPFAAFTELLPDGTEQQVVNLKTVLSIDVQSYGPVARDRKEEVAMALVSLYAEQQQEANSFNVARLTGNFVNLSMGEGSKIPYRFNTTATIQHMVIKTKPAAYFDSFDDAEITEEP